jgi:CBS domain containing-hemolysin-like protein
MTIRICLQVVLLLSSAIFSGSETAMFSLSRIDLQKLRNTRDSHSESIHAMLDEPRRLIISILCGNELVNIASAANMAAILLIFFGAENAGWINILVMVPLLLLVGEVTPKTIAVSYPVGYSTTISARVLPKWIYFVTPLREAVRLVADRVTTLIVGDVVDRENILRPDEFKTIIQESEETGVIQATERVLIDNVLEASETEVAHIMTPGPRIRFIDADLEFADALKTFREFRHPRVPVYSGHWDNVIGFLHSEDVLRLQRSGVDQEKMALKDIVRPAYFVPPTTKVDEMFNFFQERNCRAAIVLGEFGEVLGIVTIKDALTFLFGEITGKIRGSGDWQEDEDGYIVPGDMRLIDFHVFTNVDINDPVMTTIGGVVFRIFGRLPEVGDKVVHEGYEFRVMEMNGLRISRLRLQKAGQNEEEQTATLDDKADASPQQTPDEKDAASTLPTQSSAHAEDSQR